MSVFGGQYASYYDLFYADKDYSGEVTFVREVIRRYSPNARSIFEIGCGSARHAVDFVQAGFRVTGIDRSAEMIAVGHERRKKLPAYLGEHLKLMQSDA